MRGGKSLYFQFGTGFHAESQSEFGGNLVVDGQLFPAFDSRIRDFNGTAVNRPVGTDVSVDQSGFRAGVQAIHAHVIAEVVRPGSVLRQDEKGLIGAGAVRVPEAGLGFGAFLKRNGRDVLHCIRPFCPEMVVPFAWRQPSTVQIVFSEMRQPAVGRSDPCIHSRLVLVVVFLFCFYKASFVCLLSLGL